MVQNTIFFILHFKPAALFVFLFLSVLWLSRTDAFAATYTVTNVNDSGAGSLRWALTQAGTDANGTIVFDTSLAGSTITLQSDLTVWNDATQTGTTLGSASGNFSLTGLKDASCTPSSAINVDRCVFSNNSIIADLNAPNPHIVTQLSTFCTGNVLVSNSLFHDNSSLAKAGTSNGSAMCLSGSINAYVYNNTLVNNSVIYKSVGAQGAVVYFDASLLNLYNNIMFGNTANGSIDNYYGSGSIGSGNNLTPAALSLFVDAASKNSRLAVSASGAINKGDDTRSAGTYDLAGAPRKNGTVDIVHMNTIRHLKSLRFRRVAGLLPEEIL